MLKKASSLPYLIYGILTFAVLNLFTSCTSSRKINYFNDLADSTFAFLPNIQEEDRVVQVGDVLDIVFAGKDEEAVRPFNTTAKQASNAAPAGGGAGSTAPAPVSGYTVDKAGLIQLPVLGEFRVLGFSIPRLKDTLESLAKMYFNDPLVTARFGSFRITLLGEVRSPGNYSLPEERRTIFEALAVGGDLPNSAKKYNVELFRTYNGERTVHRINLLNSKVLRDPELFYMKPNDVLYVRTRPSSVFREDFTLVSAITTLVVSLVALGFTFANN